ncbi:MAG: bifunctional diaminohydroxyphosphoribosylaminopyrimidine deaminase/5-amino-6-(5-phosphoribosylamino)uracil reductase RibD [Caulobacterales bacterium]
MSDDLDFMARALALASAQLGRTAPNPSVGCVLVHDGAIVGEAATGDGGRPHAEEQALAVAGARAEGATAYVTLEPCAQRSSGAVSCTDALLAAKVTRVVVAAADPHPFADGAGLARLRAAGIRVDVGVGATQAETINAGFFRVVREGMPWIVFSSDAAGFDARFEASEGGNLRAALEAAARGGATRLYTDDADLAGALDAAGLLSARPPPP